MARLSLAAVCAALIGCHAGSSAPGDVDASGSGGSGSGSDGAPAGFEALVSRTFTIAPGEDAYRCIRVQVDREMWINAFEPLPDSVGTHHQILTLTSGTPTETGEYACDETTIFGFNDMQMLYASGMGTAAMQFPDGYAVHLAAGAWINLVIHVVNQGDTPITDGKSGIMVKTLTVGGGTPSPKEVDFMFNGTRTLNIPYNGGLFNQQGQCTVPTNWTIFALWPHMHSRGVKTSFYIQHANDPQNKTMVLDNVDYAFAAEQFYPMAHPLDVVAGATPDVLVTKCTYDNNATNNPSHLALHYGASADDEMCFTGFYKYPAGGYSLYYCSDGH